VVCCGRRAASTGQLAWQQATGEQHAGKQEPWKTMDAARPGNGLGSNWF
jgi:hypothetical protein